MYLEDDLIPGRFLRRVNRFLACVDVDGRETEVHVANSGRLGELFLPGAPVWVKPANRAGRKTRYDLALVETNGTLVSADARLPNALVAEAIADKRIFDVNGGAPAITREAQFGESRFDLLLEDECGKLYVEVKSVTLVEKGVGLFPDSPTSRGAKHLNSLAQAVTEGHRGAVVFVVQRPDCHAFTVNAPADPALARAFRHAVENGVCALAYNCAVSQREVAIDRRLPILAYDEFHSGAGETQ